MDVDFMMTDPFNPIDMTSFLRVRGNAYQVHQVMKRLITRDGVMNAVVRTLDAGYLMGRLVEVVQHIDVR
ncbi:hypothetical protein RJ639_002997 [Escallonia herrerae]|uniref:Uncharacterized protein n=1 Tax=Escallonia herrerae TaxID=1293975 RepID=A0AA89AY93_9ASTE|nr:hypothetical protein RJ639_002997 [Escallonia herrerae]